MSVPSSGISSSVSKELVVSYLVAMFSLRYALKWTSSSSTHGGMGGLFRRTLTQSNAALSSSTPNKSNLFSNISDDELFDRLQKHQSKAAKPTVAEEVRTLLATSGPAGSTGYGVLSSHNANIPGYPTGSIVGYELDEQGLPFFVLSKLSGHTKDVDKDPKVSLLVTVKDFKGAADARVTLLGDVYRVPKKEDGGEERRKVLRERYLARHNDAYWIDFG